MEAGKYSVSDFQSRFDVFMDAQFALTMGTMINRLQKSTTLASDFADELNKAREVRNFLAHSFFRERAEEFLSNSGRNSMLVELMEAQQLFGSVDKQLKAASDSLASAAGMDLNKKEQEVAEYISQAYARAGVRDASDREK